MPSGAEGNTIAAADAVDAAARWERANFISAAGDGSAWTGPARRHAAHAALTAWDIP